MIGHPDVTVANHTTIAVQKPGSIAVAYYGSADAGNGNNGYFQEDGRRYHAYLVACRNVFATDPLFTSAVFTEDDTPAIIGMAWSKSEFLGPPAFTSDGSIWAAFVRDGQGLAARLAALP